MKTEKPRKEKPRTENRAQFAPEWTDEDYIEALEEALKEATVTPVEVAEKLGCSPQNAKKHLLRLAEEGKIKSVMKAKGWGFRLPGQEE